METVLTTNNGQTNWAKLSTFGLHFRNKFVGFNRYTGKNGEILNVDPITGMKVLFRPATEIRSERVRTEKTISFRGGKRGRPAVFAFPKQQFKRGRKPLSEAEKAEREALKAELAGLVFFGPQRKRGRKALTAEQKAEREALRAQDNTGALVNPGKKPGRKSEADRIKAAKKGDIIQSKGGSWVMLEDGLASWVAG